MSSCLRVAGKHFCRADSDTALLVKGVTFGPFPGGVFLGQDIRSELERIRHDLGANAVRFYEPPQVEWLDWCAELGLMAFITIPWSQHVDFLNATDIRRETEIRVRDVVRRYRDHAAVAAYFIGNEIDTTLVRYLGPRQVQSFLERLIDIARAEQPDALFSYANYPSTEYLIPRNQDFLAYNVYLEDREAFAKYLDRLQNIAGDLPVMIAEYGVDTQQHGVDAQAEMLVWHLTEVCRAGLAGTMVFSWSDHWTRGGDVVTGWDFGLNNRDRAAKPALAKLAERWRDVERPIDGVALEATPKFSIVICTYKGAAVLEGALQSAIQLDYPDYEILVVNDGDDPEVRAIAEAYAADVRHIGIQHGGLSRARNVGAERAAGEIIAYTDDDCRLPEDWLSWLALALEHPTEPVCVGGPNIPPPAPDREKACVIVAPGGPCHVLLSDREAEHIPGCTLVVRKTELEAIGGFDVIYRAAGDDVDFCWRLEEEGYAIGFHGAAYVWHLRRASARAYLRQQRGYGRAEGLLKARHRHRFSGIGGAVWRGSVYEGGVKGLSTGSGEVIDHGQYGYEPFQTVYPDATLGIRTVFLHSAFLLLCGVLLVLGLWSLWLAVLGGIGVALSVCTALLYARGVTMERDYDSRGARLQVAWLALLQGVSRSWVRMITSRSYQQPLGFLVLLGRAIASLKPAAPSTATVRRYWNESGGDRTAFLERLSVSYLADVSGRFDLNLGRGLFFRHYLITATEYHGQGKCLTRVRIVSTMQWVEALLALTVMLVLGRLGWASWYLPAGLSLLIVGDWMIGKLRHYGRLKDVANQLGLKRF